MSNKPNTGDKVKLRTFLGATHAPKGCDPGENYWKLIGQSGVVIADLPGSDHVAVRFDVSVSGLGLHCHNPDFNSLRIQWTDLEVVRF